MSNILIVDKDPERSMLFKINLLSKFDVNVYEKNDLEDAIDFIEAIKDFDLIICGDSRFDESTCCSLSHFLVKNEHPFPMIALTEKKLDYDKCLTFSKGSKFDIIFEEIFQLLDVDSKLKILNDFIPVPLSFFIAYVDQAQPADVYIRIKNGDDPYIYLKRIHKGEKFDPKDLERYLNSKLTDFYISKDQFLDFKKSANLFLKNSLENKELSYQEKQNVSSAAFSISQQMLLNLGIDAETIQLVQKNIESMERNIGDKGACASFLKSLNGKKDGYLYNHVFLMSMLLTKLIDKFEWNTASVKEKFVYAAYFHDITLNSDKLVMINSNSQLINEDIGVNDIKKVNSHAIDAAMMVEKILQVPMGVSTIIREHHGAKNGYGFSEELNMAISPLSMIFIVVENFASKFLDLSDKFDQQEINKILEHQLVQFTKGTYLDAAIQLDKIVFKN